MLCTVRRLPPFPYDSDKLVPSGFTDTAREWTLLDHDIFSKQKLFMRTIVEKPEYGKYVHELTWTVLDTKSHTW
jgi:hypothetical protein